ncbi:MAG: glycoside hydrolase family 15 protein [Terriglobales bacterium]
MYRPISDYAVIGDCHTAALISSQGSIDWLCLPRFDSPALFLHLLDDARGGYCAVRVEDAVAASRRYLPRTNILETKFQTWQGTVLVTDFMPVRVPPVLSDSGQDIESEHSVVRLLRCLWGEVEVTVETKPTFAFAGESTPPRLERESDSTIVARGNDHALHIHFAGRTLHADGGTIVGRFRLRAGEVVTLVLTYVSPGRRISPLRPEQADEALARTERFWQKWCDGLEYDGEYAELVQRSALLLKLMVYEPTGAIVAAPTTSLPEVVGGERNWDYRFCWLRDATFTMIALMNLGYFGEARDFLRYMKHTVGLNNFQVLYRINGTGNIEERELGYLEGYRSSRPVRVGNAAAQQQQLDVFGEVLHCLYLYAAHPETRTTAQSFWAEFGNLVRATADKVVNDWRKPDSGLWEMRGEPRHFVYSKGTCWLALDRAIRLAEQYSGAQANDDLRRWRRQRDALYDSFIHQGFNPHVGAFVQCYGSTELDASILRLPLMGVLDANHPKMLATIEHIERRLMRNGLVYRYSGPDRLPGQEGAFAACAFWLVDNYVLCGRLKDARNLFRHLVSYANDVGLLAEEIEPETGMQLGNFPQAFTHIALINAALRLTAARSGRKPTTHAVVEKHTPQLPEAA